MPPPPSTSVPSKPADSGPNFWDRKWLMFVGGALLAVALFAAYRNSFSVPYLLDDPDSIEKNTSIQKGFLEALNPPRNSGITVSGRPLLNLTLAINYHIHGTSVAGYHAGNLIIHFLAALCLVGIVRRTLKKPVLASRFGKHATLLGFASGLLWALHPLQTESVTYVIQRAESLVGLCYLLTTYAFIRATDSSSRVWMVVTVASCFVGMTAKEVMSTVPIILFLYDRTFVTGSFVASWKQRRGFYLWLASSWLVLLALIVSSGGRGSTVGFGTVSVLDYLLTQVSGVCRYLRLSLVPLGLIFDYGAVVEKETEVIVASALLLLPILAVTVWAVIKKPAVGFLGAWIFIILSPTSTIIPVVTQLVAEHRMYTSLAAVMVGIVLVLYTISRKHCVWLIVFVGAVYGVLTFNRNIVYQSPISIWEDTERKVPSSARALTCLGNAYLNAGRTQEGLAAFSEAVNLIPDAWSLTNLGVSMAKLGEVKEGLEVIERAVRLRPEFAQYHAIYGNALLVAKRPADGIAALKKAVSLDRENVSYHFDLANAYSQIDLHAEAEAEYKEVLRRAPDDVQALTNYGAMLCRIKRIPESLELLERALRLKPDLARVHSNLGVALLATPRTEEAVKHLKKALEIEPDLAQAHYNLANYYAETGNNAEAIAHYEVLLKKDEPNAETLSNLAVVYARENRLTDAVKTLEKALALDPNHSAARENYEKITNYLKQHPQ
ncbi:MAG: tetratricopeptide repeat protein [Nibricoccus sp.]